MFSAAIKSAHSAATEANYIEDVFSTYLYTGNGSTQTITNNIDLSTEGGMVWVKARQVSADNELFDTARGVYYYLSSNTTDASTSLNPNGVTAFNTTGFSVKDDSNGSNGVNGASGGTFSGTPPAYASWTFRKQAKFFDVVTYTGNGNTSEGQTISHSLGSTPGCIIIKATSTTGDWIVYHRSTPWAGGAGPGAIYLNSTAASSTSNSAIDYCNATTFSVGSNTAITAANTNGVTYVAYLFAHNAGGFGATGTDNVISCGTYTGNGSATGPTVTLGYEPQYLMIKRTDSTGNWFIYDVMRGFCQTADAELYANLSNAEGSGFNGVTPIATGFQLQTSNSGLNGSGATYIYIAIRRGPMKTPTDGTSVFGSSLYTGNDADGRTLTGLALSSPDLIMDMRRTPTSSTKAFVDRLRGWSAELGPTSDGAEDSTYGIVSVTNNTAVVNRAGYYSSWNVSGSNYVWQMFKRAPGFFDEVCYTGTGSARTVNHNLGVAPEMIICKKRSASDDWVVYVAPLGVDKALFLNNDATPDSDFPPYLYWNNTAPTSTVFSVKNQSTNNTNGATYVAYLFATVAGVSKVGSYTGSGTTKQIDCGFTGGARFVMIKRTDSTGDWYVWDSARGIVSGNDPYLLMNSTAVEVTNTDYVDTYSAGFEISSTAPSAINANGGSFIYLAIA